MIKPEIRMDSASDKFYTDADGAATDSLSVFMVAAIYSF